MAQARVDAVQCLSPAGLHRMAYKEWGARDNPKVLVCVHGLTRVADDFDLVAQELSGEYRVVCPDVVGRGRSDWLRDPRYYVVPQYVSDMVTLLARLNAQTVHWLGTSMGGLIGIGLAGQPGSPITRLVLNDVGPALNPDAIARIAAYVGQPKVFPTLEAGEQYIREISRTFGTLTEAQWHKFALDVLRQDESRQWRLHYDPSIAVPIRAFSSERAAEAEAAAWAAYDSIRCPTLLVRGAQSDLLAVETAQEMTRRGPRAQLVEFAGVGHAPALLQRDQIDILTRFLLSPER